ncbi:hypothetical protein [Aestuariivivens insulae]|uniref:hypothetical protein n=1 Tax=Aestuariivivens insulae TaxID=1621988 RepID=UPI001F57A50C|nr:hypothetical protein [Aestuariivivens insulae]
MRKKTINFKDYHKKIEDGFNTIFHTRTLRGIETQKYGGFNGYMTIVKEPLVRQQIIQLAILCQEIPANITLKGYRNGVLIEFWE